MQRACSDEQLWLQALCQRALCVFICVRAATESSPGVCLINGIHSYITWFRHTGHELRFNNFMLVSTQANTVNYQDKNSAHHICGNERKPQQCV